jgi:UDP-N-acetylmuramoyl-tripeptide--D-alanyl-D-alanine ligase
MITRSCHWLIKVTNGTLIGSEMDENCFFQGVSIDSKKIQTQQLYIPLVTESLDGHFFVEDALNRGAIIALWQRDHLLPENFKFPVILVEDTRRALQNMAAAYRQELQVKVVAVTGSNGKTTTKDLIASLLTSSFRVHKTQKNQNNQVGVPLTLLSMPENCEVAVIEMGMNQPKRIERLSQIAQPDLAVITNIGDAHIGFFHSREKIAKAKLEILKGLKEDGAIIINGDEPLLLKDYKNIGTVIKVGWNETNDDYPSTVQNEGLKGIRFYSKQTTACFHVPLLGRHNVINALFAILVARYLGCEENEIRHHLANASVTEGRLEVKRSRSNMLLINDAYNASPTSMKVVLDLLSELDPKIEKWVLLGDMLELGSSEEAYHREIGVHAIRSGVNRIYTFGERGKWITEGAIEAKQNSNQWIKHFSNTEEAISHFDKEGNKSVVLLVKASRALKLEEIVKQLI